MQKEQTITSEGQLLEKRKRAARGQVIIFARWCKGCRLCVEFCPGQVLAMGEDEIPYVALPENCTACRWCEIHCPDLAILVKPIGE